MSESTYLIIAAIVISVFVTSSFFFIRSSNKQRRSSTEAHGYNGPKRRGSIAHSEIQSEGFDLEPASKPTGENVECSVFAPPGCAPGSTFMVQVALHITERAEDAKARAQQSDPTASQRANKSLSTLLEIGDKLELRLMADTPLIESQTSSIIWNGDIPMEEFLIHVPEGFEKPAVFFTLMLLLKGQPVGSAKFRVAISQQPESTPTETKLSRYKNVFVSYSSKDRGEVLRHYQLLHKFGLTTFLDVMSIRTGDRWEPEILRALADADLVLLYWSTNSKESDWVIKEAEMAVKHRKNSGGLQPDILPIILEVPPPAPPESLSDLQFNDPVRYIIAAHDQAQAP